jgi:hypothetical protein
LFGYSLQKIASGTLAEPIGLTGAQTWELGSPSKEYHGTMEFDENGLKWRQQAVRTNKSDIRLRMP